MTDDGSVAAVLETTWAGEAEPMYRALTGRRSFATLSYEEWISPMKATSGRVCLRIDEPARTRWVRWAATDEFRTRSDPAEFDRETRIEPSRVRRCLSDHSARPVLIENAPFGTATGETDRRPRRGEPSR